MNNFPNLLQKKAGMVGIYGLVKLKVEDSRILNFFKNPALQNCLKEIKRTIIMIP